MQTWQCTSRRLARAWIVALLLSAPAAFAQEPATPTPTASATPSPTPIAVPQVTTEVEATIRTLRKLQATLVPSQAVTTIRTELPQVIAAVNAQQERAAAGLASEATLELLADQAARWRLIKAKLPGWIADLTARAREVEATLERLDEIEALWMETGELTESSGAPSAIADRVAQVLAETRATREAFLQRRSALLTLQGQVSAQDTRINEGLGQIAALREGLVSRVFERNSLALWQPELLAQLADRTGARVRAALAAEFADMRVFLVGQGTRLILHAAIFAALAVALRSARRRVRQRTEKEAGLTRAADLFEFPHAVSLLLAILATPWIYPAIPPILGQFLGAAALVPTILIMRHFSARQLYPLLNALIVFYFVDRLRELASSLPVLARLIFVVEMIGASLLLGWLLRPSRLGQISAYAARAPAFRALGMVGRGALFLCLGALVADVSGYTRVARLTGNAVLNSAYAGVIAYAGVRVVDSLVTFGLRVWPLNGLRIVRDNRIAFHARFRRLAQIAALVAWGLFTLDRLQLRERLFDLVVNIFSAELAIGSLTLTLGAVAAFGFTIWASFFVSRSLRFVLQEDVYPRLDLGRGVPYAISTFLHYGLLLVGFFFAVAATGIDLNRFAIVAGAFGVGIGFGLQNVVNNFVSGLILLSERPVQVGDMVESAEVLGEVRRIGIRSSTIRTLQGAEVIVPNSQLISERVVNWTLSDRQRRIDIPVGVAYGTDPTRVLSLLREVAIAHPGVMTAPEPVALFRGFGDSSLNFELRAWSNRFEESIRVQSEISVQVNDALKREGIEIPFPQRDLHVRSVSPRAGAELRGAAGGETDD